MVRLYRVLRDGRLAEVAGTTTRCRPGTIHPNRQVASKPRCVHASGRTPRWSMPAKPTLFETMIGCDSIVHVRLADGSEIGCGIGWHGPVPFVLPAAFPRFAVPLVLSRENEAAVQVVLTRDNLVRHERGWTRRASRWWRAAAGCPVVPAAGERRHGENRASTPTLGVWRGVRGPGPLDALRRNLRAFGGAPRVRDGASDDLLVVTGEASGQIWRHHIDRDGVETWRKPDEEAAAGLLYRDRLAPVTLAATDAATPDAGHDTSPLLQNGLDAEEAEDAPADSLLAKGEAYVAALAALRSAQEAVTGDTPLAAALVHLRVLAPALETLEADHAAVEARLLLLQAEEGRIRPGRLGAALARIDARLPDELAAIRLVTLAPSRRRHLVDPAPFGVAVEVAFPEAGYDIEEAALCLAFRRPSAAAFHCMRIVECGLAGLSASLRVDLPGEHRQWTQIMAVLRRALGRTRRACWRRWTRCAAAGGAPGWCPWRNTPRRRRTACSAPWVRSWRNSRAERVIPSARKSGGAASPLMAWPKPAIHDFAAAHTVKSWMPTPAFARGRLFVGMTGGRRSCASLSGAWHYTSPRNC